MKEIKGPWWIVIDGERIFGDTPEDAMLNAPYCVVKDMYHLPDNTRFYAVNLPSPSVPDEHETFIFEHLWFAKEAIKEYQGYMKSHERNQDTT